MLEHLASQGGPSVNNAFSQELELATWGTCLRFGDFRFFQPVLGDWSHGESLRVYAFWCCFSCPCRSDPCTRQFP